MNFGSLLKDELKSRGIQQKDFAEAFGLKTSNLSGILNGKRKIPVSMIPFVSELLGIDESTIINSQKNFSSDYRIEVNDSEEEKQAKRELEDFEKIISVKSLLKDLPEIPSKVIDKLKMLKKYYNLTTPRELSEQFSLMSETCFRKSDKTGLDQIMITTWVVKARTLANQLQVNEIYDRSKMPKMIEALCDILHKNKNNTPKQVEELLRSHGIGYIELKKESKASIDGYSFMLEGKPYIAVTCRFDRIDNYAFNIMHELGHIYLNHTIEGGRINIGMHHMDSLEEIPFQEEEANKFATENLIPNKIWFLAPQVPMNPVIIQKKYTLWARSKNLNPWIVLGRVSHETGMYRFTSDNSRKINTGKEGVSMTK